MSTNDRGLGMTKGDKPKRFPPTYTVANLKRALQSAYGLSTESQRLVARCVPSGGSQWCWGLWGLGDGLVRVDDPVV